MKQTTFLTAICIASALFISSCKKDDDKVTPTPNATDQDFLIKAAYANHDEIDFAQLALTKTADDSVKNFAQMMVAEHTMALASLDSIASRYSITLPTTIDSLHAVLKPQLAALSGLSFDTTYMNSQVNDHVKTIALFQNEVSNGLMTDIKNYATSNLPHLQMHLEEANNVRAHLQ